MTDFAVGDFVRVRQDAVQPAGKMHVVWRGLVGRIVTSARPLARGTWAVSYASGKGAWGTLHLTANLIEPAEPSEEVLAFWMLHDLSE
jgi:hypothetical protein